VRRTDAAKPDRRKPRDQGKPLRRSRTRAILIALVSSSWLAAAADAQTPRTESYGRLPAQHLSLCQPQTADQRRKPAVLLIHGGGWSGGEASAFNSRCVDLAKHGFVAATIEYRLANAGDAASRWPAQIDDVRSAFAWLHARADALNVDPGHICAYGESAGGHLALWLGLSEPRLSCVVDAFGPTDLPKLAGPAYNKGFATLFGPDVTAETLKKASPLYGKIGSLPPTAMIQGENDDLVPPEQTISLQNLLRQNKVANVVYSYPAGHSWAGISKEDALAIMNSVMEFMRTAKRPAQ
jgi:acetyl esterase/lipase